MKLMHHTAATLLLAGLTISTTALASLESRPGGMVYDTDLNITWLADANYAQTSGYDSDGLMNFYEATTWANQLVYGGYDDWRLSGSYGDRCGFDSCLKLEISHLYSSELGVNGGYSILSGDPAKLAMFSNIQPSGYYTGAIWSSVPNIAYVFLAHTGQVWNSNFYFSNDYYYAWAVRDGDVSAVPVPAAVWLFGSALASLGLLKCRRAKRENG